MPDGGQLSPGHYPSLDVTSVRHRSLRDTSSDVGAPAYRAPLHTSKVSVAIPKDNNANYMTYTNNGGYDVSDGVTDRRRMALALRDKKRSRSARRSHYDTVQYEPAAVAEVYEDCVISVTKF